LTIAGDNCNDIGQAAVHFTAYGYAFVPRPQVPVFDRRFTGSLMGRRHSAFFLDLKL